MFNFNRSALIIFAVVMLMFIIGFMSFIYLNDINISFFDWLNDIIYNLLTPILNLVNNITNTVRNFFATLFSINEINQEIEELRQKNSILERQILFLENINRENQRLRELLDYKEKVDYQMTTARVIANSPSPWEKILTINKGRKNGIERRMPVITYDGFLVGRIENVGSNSSQLRLITDQDFVVGGIISRTDSREIALVRGSGRNDQNNIMDNIAWDADIEENDVVLTSGFSNNFPPGLKIGTVINIESDNYGLSQKAEIDLYINNITIEEVMVITNFNLEEIDTTEINETAEGIETIETAETDDSAEVERVD